MFNSLIVFIRNTSINKSRLNFNGHGQKLAWSNNLGNIFIVSMILDFRISWVSYKFNIMFTPSLMDKCKCLIAEFSIIFRWWSIISKVISWSYQTFTNNGLQFSMWTLEDKKVRERIVLLFIFCRYWMANSNVKIFNDVVIQSYQGNYPHEERDA